MNFRAEINVDLNDLQMRAEAIKAKLKDKMYHEDTKKGFLMGNLADYERCMSFDKEKLNWLLESDQEIWTTNLHESKKRAELA